MMKKTVTVFLLCLTLVLFMGASEWEGSAAASSDLHFPSSGFYAATNSYPRNTVVEIVNLSNGRSVRAIVTQGLDTPGLLAVLSPQAAEAIGLNFNSVGRILMSASSEPMVNPGSGNVYASGDPDHDPAASVRVNGGLNPALRAELDALLSAELLAAETVAAANAVADPAAEPEAEPVAFSAADLAETDRIVDPWTDPEADRIAELETDPAAFPAADRIADTLTDPPADRTAAATATAESAPVTSEEPPAELTSGTDSRTAASANPVTAPSSHSGARPAASSDPNTSAYTPAPSHPATTPEETEALANLPPDYAPPSYDDFYFYMIPAEPRIPVEPDPVLNPEDFILPLDQYPSDFYPDYYPRNLYPDSAVSGGREYAINPADVIPPVSPAVPDTPPPVTGTTPQPVAPAAPPTVFSVPVISAMDRGSYYIQVTAGSEMAGIENEINKIGRSYPMVVMPIISSGRTMYRLLVGPVNQGESGALLERLKLTYKDAFIWSGR